jgi:hypothetical protein
MERNTTLKPYSYSTLPLTGLTDCDCCKNPCPSIHTDYHPINEIRFCRVQVLWLIEYIDILRDGNYPKQPKETGYVDSIIQRRPSQEAGFVNAALVAAELDARLQATKKDGETLEHEVRVLGVDVYELLSPAARNALGYCSGWKRKRLKYSAWFKQGNYRRTKT